VQVGQGEQHNFSFFYTPKEIGQHELTGRVHYNKKVTFEKGTVMNVMASGGKAHFEIPSGLRLLPLVVYAVIIILIMFLLSKIKRRRRILRR
jgi:hypothetical protein